MGERHRRLFFLAMFALVFYLVGASFVESFVTYPTWRLVGRNEFPAPDARQRWLPTLK